MLDSLLGDPVRLHPVAGFGQLSLRLERRLWAPRRATGIVHCAVLVGGTFGAARLLDRIPSRALRGLWRAALVWTILGGRSLRAEAAGLHAALSAGDLDGARRRAPALVGRDPGGLDGLELARATVESVAENTADAVVASLLWCGLAGAPVAAAHRAANTLDAMVGHRNERYTRFGWASARLDDLANWLPARLTAALTVGLAPVVGGSRPEALRVARRDGGSHPSPNAGLVEAAFAGALAIRLGGTNRYGELVEQRPSLGSGPRASIADIPRAIELSRAVELGALAVCAALAGRPR